MKNKTHNRLLLTIGSTQLTLVILAVFAVAIAAATFLEARVGTEGARALVYNARWFEALLAFLIVNLIASLVVHFPYHVRQTGFVMTHIGFIIVLVASGITRFMGYEGNMPIREGTSTDYMYSARDYISVSLGGESDYFPVRLYKPGRNNLSRTLTVGGEHIRVSVEEYLPHYQMQLVEGEGGQPALLYTAAGMQRGQQEILLQGEEFQAQGVTVRFAESDVEITPPPSKYGELVVQLGDEAGRLPVMRDLSGALTMEGHRFRIVELAPSFQVGKDPSPDDPLTNPAIRVEVETPSGEKGQRLLFAFHPDFDMGHTGQTAVFENINMVYKLERNVFLFWEDNGVSGRAGFQLGIDRHGEAAHDTSFVEAGARFRAEPGTIFRADPFAFVINEAWQSAVEKPVISTNSNLPAAVRLTLENGDARAEAFVPRYDDAVPVDLGGTVMRAAYGPQVIELPYRLHLDDFLLITYPGSENPASFESHVRIYDEERGVDGEAVRIYMNHPLSYRGFKHFQSSYDRDRLGTVLSVNHDPGKLPTYLGYIMIGVGFLITLTRGIWYRPAVARRPVS